MPISTQISQLPPAGDARLVSGVARTRARFTRWWRYRRTLSELSGLSNRELADLGLHRSELKRVAFMAVYES